jgi:hypothetical protein
LARVLVLHGDTGGKGLSKEGYDHVKPLAYTYSKGAGCVSETAVTLQLATEKNQPEGGKLAATDAASYHPFPDGCVTPLITSHHFYLSITASDS